MATSLADVGRALSESIGEREVVCDTHGAYTSKGTRITIGKCKEIWTGCPGCAKDRAESDARQAESDRQVAAKQRLEEAMQSTALPSRFIGRSFDNYVVENDGQARALRVSKAYAEKFDELRERGTSLIFSGSPGTGKSHLAAAIMQAIMPKHIGVYVTMMDLVRMLRDTWRKDASESEGAVLSRLSEIPLLVIDEVGVQYGTEGERVLFFDVMDRRYRQCKPTILITNQGMADFKITVGERVLDRLTEVAKWVSFDWESRRKLRGPQS